MTLLSSPADFDIAIFLPLPSKYTGLQSNATRPENICLFYVVIQLLLSTESPFHWLRPWVTMPSSCSSFLIILVFSYSNKKLIILPLVGHFELLVYAHNTKYSESMKRHTVKPVSPPFHPPSLLVHLIRTADDINFFLIIPDFESLQLIDFQMSFPCV